MIPHEIALCNTIMLCSHYFHNFACGRRLNSMFESRGMRGKFGHSYWLRTMIAHVSLSANIRFSDFHPSDSVSHAGIHGRMSHPFAPRSSCAPPSCQRILKQHQSEPCNHSGSFQRIFSPYRKRQWNGCSVLSCLQFIQITFRKVIQEIPGCFPSERLEIRIGCKPHHFHD